MTEYSCSVCNYTSALKEHVTRHINRKKSCGQGTKEIIEIPNEICCEFCNKQFTSQPNLTFHLKNTCKKKDIVLKQKVKDLEKQLRDRSTPLNDDDDEYEEYIYLIKIYPYEDKLYKIGRSKNIQKRLSDYKRYKIVFITGCNDAVKCENDLKKLYRLNTIQRKDMGTEYFSGEYHQMINIVQTYFTSEN